MEIMSFRIISPDFSFNITNLFINPGFITPYNIRYEINNCKARARSQVIIEATMGVFRLNPAQYSPVPAPFPMPMSVPGPVTVPAPVAVPAPMPRPVSGPVPMLVSVQSRPIQIVPNAPTL